MWTIQHKTGNVYVYYLLNQQHAAEIRKYHTSHRTHLLHWLRWCLAPFLLVLVTFASFPVILFQKVKKPRQCFGVACSVEPCKLDIMKVKQNLLTDKQHQRISHNSPVNYPRNVMTLADAVIALFGYHIEQKIVYNGSSRHSWS